MEKIELKHISTRPLQDKLKIYNIQLQNQEALKENDWIDNFEKLKGMYERQKQQGLNVFIDDVTYEKVDGENTLTIILDSEEMIPLNKVVMATRILNPILDKLDLIKESYMLDVYAKSKGDVENEW